MFHKSARTILPVAPLCLAGALLAACGDDGSSTGETGTAPMTVPMTTGDEGSTGDEAGAPTTGDGGSASTSSATIEPDSTTTTPDPTTTGEPEETGDPDTTGDPETTDTGETETEGVVCDPNAVPDALAFDYVRTLDIGIEAQASWYNIAAKELVFIDHQGPGKRYTLDGTFLGDVAVPPGVDHVVDGGTYDQVKEVGLIVDQLCNLAEVDPVTLEQISLTALDPAHGLSTCSGLAIGLDGNLYVTSTDTEEVVALTRDLTTVVSRFKVDDDGLSNVDGISLIAGSENFLVLSTFDLKAAIFDPQGNVVVPVSTIGQAAPLIGGDMPGIPDASLTVCANGHAWVCEGLFTTKCYEYAPMGGDSDSCPCVLPQ